MGVYPKTLSLLLKEALQSWWLLKKYFLLFALAKLWHNIGFIHVFFLVCNFSLVFYLVRTLAVFLINLRKPLIIGYLKVIILNWAAV